MVGKKERCGGYRSEEVVEGKRDANVLEETDLQAQRRSVGDRIGTQLSA